MILHYVCKVMRDSKHDEEQKKLFLWEKDDYVVHCRSCKTEFSNLKWKHHCRKCGGVYCENCLIYNLTLENREYEKCCCGCALGNSPGEKIIEGVRPRFSTLRQSPMFAPPTLLPLEFLTPGSSRHSSSVISAGVLMDVDNSPSDCVFQFVNKDKSHCAIKLMTFYDPSTVSSDGDTKRHSNVLNTCWEIPRPLYTLLPPEGTLTTRIPTTQSVVELCILLNRAVKTAGGKNKPSYAHTEENLTISNFQHFIAYRLTIQHAPMNKLLQLQYTGEGRIENTTQQAINAMNGNGSSSSRANSRRAGSGYSDLIAVRLQSDETYVDISEIVSSFSNVSLR